MRAAKPHPPAASRLRRRRASRTLWRLLAWSVVVPVVAFSYGGVVWSRSPSGQAALRTAADRALSISASLGLAVGDIEVEGRETTDSAMIMAALGAERGTPILAVSPSRTKALLEALPWVRSAAIERRLPGTLFVRLVERHPLAVWQHDGRQELIDRQGEVIPVGDLSRFARLPTVVGEHAPSHAAALIDMLAQQPEMAARVTAAVRVDDRRWNLRIDDAIDVLLPEEDAAAAWSRLAVLEREQKLLQRDIQAVDMRLPDRLVLRVVAAPAQEPASAKKPRAAGKST